LLLPLTAIIWLSISRTTFIPLYNKI
jgi:hypothetical protein